MQKFIFLPHFPLRNNFFLKYQKLYEICEHHKEILISLKNQFVDLYLNDWDKI